MKTQEWAINHLLEAVNAAMAEAHNQDNAEHLQAETKLRLVSMSDEEVWELAKITSSAPIRPLAQVYEQLQEAIREHQLTATHWLKALEYDCPSDTLGRGTH